MTHWLSIDHAVTSFHHQNRGNLVLNIHSTGLRSCIYDQLIRMTMSSNTDDSIVLMLLSISLYPFLIIIILLSMIWIFNGVFIKYLSNHCAFDRSVFLCSKAELRYSSSTGNSEVQIYLIKVSSFIYYILFVLIL